MVAAGAQAKLMLPVHLVPKARYFTVKSLGFNLLGLGF